MHENRTNTNGRRGHAKLWRALAVTGVATVGLVGTAGMAAAGDNYPDGGGVGGGGVSRGQVSDPGDPGVKVAGKTQTRGQMPFTGGDVTVLATLGGGAVIVGGLLVARSRRSRAASLDTA